MVLELPVGAGRRWRSQVERWPGWWLMPLVLLVLLVLLVMLLVLLKLRLLCRRMSRGRWWVNPLLQRRCRRLNL